jgi:hypothetical protein
MSRIAPALADGRAFTSYLGNNAYNDFLQKKFNITSTSAYRTYLQQHADEVLRESRKLVVISSDAASTTWSDASAQANWNYGQWTGTDEGADLAAYNA